MRNKIQCATSLRASSPIWQTKQAARERANERWSCGKGEEIIFLPLALMSLFLCGSCVTSRDYPNWRACSQASVPLNLSPTGQGRKLDWWPAGNIEYREYLTPFSHVFFFFSEDVIYLSHQSQWITSSSICIILQIIPHSVTVKYTMIDICHRHHGWNSNMPNIFKIW